MANRKRKNQKIPKKLAENLRKVVFEFISSKHYIPYAKNALLEKLCILPQHFDIFDAVLKELKEEGTLSLIQDRYTKTLPLEPTEMLIRGTLRVHPRGFGFVEPDDPKEQDIFIPKTALFGAIDSDTVDVIVDKALYSPKGPEGKIYTIVSRKKKQIVAICVQNLGKQALCISNTLGKDKTILVDVDPHQYNGGIQVGDQLLLDSLVWESGKDSVSAKIASFLGPISDPSKDTLVAIYDQEIRAEFSKACLEEALKFGSKVTKEDCEGRVDLTKLECITIDPDTAKDFDDALSLEVDDNGFKLGVHIADVAHYVSANSALDTEASLRGNSTYFPGTVVPMLPHELSSELCSLKEGVLRLTVSILFEIDLKGATQNVSFCRSVIKSKKRLTYKQAKQILDGSQKSHHKNMLENLQKLCLLLKGKRKERGSVELVMPELVIHVDEKGAPTGVETVQYDITHQMVEECMLLANEAVAKYLADKNIALTYRVHEEPDPESIQEFCALVEAFGYKMPKEVTPHDIQGFFLSVEDQPLAQYLSTAYVRSMRLACYSADNIGHYGLSLEHYCHFTSPIRRYVDLIAGRLLFGAVYDKKTLDEICLKASEKERQSAKAESQVKQLKKLRLLNSIVDQEKFRQFVAVVTRIKPFGIYFDIPELMFEGFLHISELDNDYFVFNEKTRVLKGTSTHIQYSAGDSLLVMVKNISLLTQEVDFELVVHPQKKAPQKKRHHGKRQ